VHRLLGEQPEHDQGERAAELAGRHACDTNRRIFEVN
jgi:hypothetical protein